MLVRNFMTADALGISEDVRTGLVTVLGMLERGEILEEEFDMKEWECGTTACIGGWVERVANCKIDSSKSMNLYDLFYPHDDSNGDSATRAQAARAISSYLTTGDPRWRDVMAAPQVAEKVPSA